MTENNVRRLSDVIEPETQQGLNDGYWSLMEHQLYEAKFALQVARRQMEAVGEHPENAGEAELAGAILEDLTHAYIATSQAQLNVTRRMTGTETAERMGGKENA